MNKKVLWIGTIPIAILIDILLFNQMVDLIRQPSDVAVLVATILIGVLFVGNYYLINFYKNKFKSK